VKLTVLLLSCRRVPYLLRTVEATREHFASVERDIEARWVCFDNGSSPEDQRRLEALGFDLLLLSKNLGQGPALNQLLGAVRTEHFLLLEDDWVLETPSRVPFVREAVAIPAAEPRLGQVKLDALHRIDFADRRTYAGPVQFPGSCVRVYVQNPDQDWGSFTCPPGRGVSSERTSRSGSGRPRANTCGARRTFPHREEPRHAPLPIHWRRAE
jgi:hypothetical protein